MERVSITQEGITVSLQSSTQTLDELFSKASRMLDSEIVKRTKTEDQPKQDTDETIPS
jgi:hypothetical protein